MKRLPIVIGFVLAVSACASPASDPASSGSTSAQLPTPQPPVTTTEVVLPADPVAARDGQCPYLDKAFVAETNGQQVGKVQLSADDPPACFFSRSGGGEQLRVQVLTGLDPAVARAVVDRAAPVATSDPATFPGGWEGGKQPTDTGAVFAVAKEGSAIVVITNQQQTIKASRIAEQALTTLGL